MSSKPLAHEALLWKECLEVPPPLLPLPPPAVAAAQEGPAAAALSLPLHLLLPHLCCCCSRCACCALCFSLSGNQQSLALSLSSMALLCHRLSSKLSSRWVLTSLRLHHFLEKAVNGVERWCFW